MSQGPVVQIGYAREQLRKWVEARDALAAGQSYSIGGRTLTRSDASTVEGNITRWHRSVLALEARANGGVRPLGSQALFGVPGASGVEAGVYGAGWDTGRRLR